MRLLKKAKYNVAIVGASGAVGTEMVKTLERRKFPISSLKLLASKRSAGMKVPYKRKNLTIEELTKNSFKDVDIALFSAGGSISEKYAPIAVESGAIVVDNTSFFRMDPDVPLIVPEINGEEINNSKGIIANPNCSTIQMVLVLKPIHDVYSIKRVVVSTYQSVSGAGQMSIEALKQESMNLMSGNKIKSKKMGKQIAFNLIPKIDVFLKNDYTKEEVKMINETKKIFNDDSVKVTATCVRVPVIRAHSESINIETNKSFKINDVKKLLKKVDNLVVRDDPKKDIFPMPIDAEGNFDTYVGRIRKDDTAENALNLWVVSDNLLKGAALNAIQIAEKLTEYAISK